MLKESSKSVPASTRLEDPSKKERRGRPNRHQSIPSPRERGLIQPFFSVSRPMDPLMWLAGLLALSGDVETNPGPTTQTWTCDMCSTEITGRQTSYKCNSSPSHWVHKHCTTLIRNTDYTPTWKCNIHNQQNNTITDQHHQLTDNSNNMQQNLNINQPHSINNNKTQQQINSKKTITIIQININGLTTTLKREETLPHSTRRKLSQLRTNKSSLLMTYLHKIDPANHPAANCPLCNDPNHDTLHLFNCPDIATTLTVWDLWTDPVGVAALLYVWGEKLGGPRAGV